MKHVQMGDGTVVTNKYEFEYTSVANPRLGVIVISWGAKNLGFGEATFLLKENGSFHIDTECMSDAFIEELLAYAAKNSSRDPEEAPKECYAVARRLDPTLKPKPEEIVVAEEIVKHLRKHHKLTTFKQLERLGQESRLQLRKKRFEEC